MYLNMMKKRYFIPIAILIVIIIAIAFIITIKIIPNFIEGKNQGEGIYEYYPNGSKIPETSEDTETNLNQGESQDSSSIGGESSGSSGGGSSGGSSEEVQRTYESPQCMLVRPGNLPDISCTAERISADSVILKIRNEFGQSINASIHLDSCTPKLSGVIENNQEKEFVFSCSNNEYFNEALSISYSFGDNQVDIGGFISGSVQ